MHRATHPAKSARPGRLRHPAKTSHHRVEPLECRCLLSAGSLDPTFGTGGTVTTDLVGPTDALAAAVSRAAPDGKLLIAGQTRHAGGNDFALARYRADGSLDPTFGTGGRVVTDVNAGSFDEIVDLAVLPSGKILAAGNTARNEFLGYGNGADFAVARYDSDGSLDTTFGGGDGIVTTNLGGLADPDGGADFDTADVAAVLALAPGGRFVVAGWTGFVGGGDVALVRYNADGSLDTSFGTGGVVATPVLPESSELDISASDDAARALYVGPDGRILVGGRTDTDFLLVRYLPDGRIDPSFGRGAGQPSEGVIRPSDPGDGFITTSFAGGSAAINDLAVWSGRVVVAGTVDFGAGSDGDRGADFALARYDLRTGAPDRAFSGDGKLTIDFAGKRDEANAVLVRPDGTIFAAGFATTPTRFEDFALARIDLRGRLVGSFGRLGKVTTDFGTIEQGTYDRATDATFTRDGRILLVGSAGAIPGGDFVIAGPRFGLAKYSSGGAPDRDFGAAHDGTETTNFRGSLANMGADAVVQRDGKIVLVGNVTGPSGLWDVVLVRYNRDGSLDRTFGGTGVVTTDLSEGRDGRSTDAPAKVILDRYGRILVVGSTDRRQPGVLDSVGTRRWDLFVARFWPNGTLDRSFNNGAGFVVTDLGNAEEHPSGIDVASDGRIVVVGETRTPGESWSKIAVVRYLPLGGLDPTFDRDGIALTDLPGPIGEHSGGVAVQPDGRVVVSGAAWEPVTGQNFALLRYTPGGALDPTFGGGDGWLTTDFGGADAARAVALTPDGKILAAGEGQSSHALHYSDFAVSRYLSDGTPDPTFGNNGRALLAPDNADRSWEAANDVLVQADGKVVLVGTTVAFPDTSPTGSGAGRGDFAAVRFNPDGSADNAFGDGGFAAVHFDGFSIAGGGAIDPAGKLILAGGVSSDDRNVRKTGTDYAVARLLL